MFLPERENEIASLSTKVDPSTDNEMVSPFNMSLLLYWSNLMRITSKKNATIKNRIPGFRGSKVQVMKWCSYGSRRFSPRVILIRLRRMFQDPWNCNMGKDTRRCSPQAINSAWQKMCVSIVDSLLKPAIGNAKNKNNTNCMKPRRLKPAATIVTQPLDGVIQDVYNINTKDTKLIGFTPDETCCQG